MTALGAGGEGRETLTSERSGATGRAWFAVAASIGVWIVHLTALSALTEWTCTTGPVWLLHAITLATLAAVIGCGWLALGAARAGGPSGFVGRLALLVVASNLALIALEGSYVFFISPCT